MSEQTDASLELGELTVDSLGVAQPAVDQPVSQAPEAEVATEQTHELEPGVESESTSDSPNPVESPLQGYELVASLMTRQDDVLAQIDQLDKQIMAMINQITAEREAEKAAEFALLEGSDSDTSDTDSVEFQSEAGQSTENQDESANATPVRRAA